MKTASSTTEPTQFIKKPGVGRHLICNKAVDCKPATPLQRSLEQPRLFPPSPVQHQQQQVGYRPPAWLTEVPQLPFPAPPPQRSYNNPPLFIPPMRDCMNSMMNNMSLNMYQQQNQNQHQLQMQMQQQQQQQQQQIFATLAQFNPNMPQIQCVDGVYGFVQEQMVEQPEQPVAEGGEGEEGEEGEPVVSEEETVTIAESKSQSE